jgi:transcriptional regulator with XRE-family HTH domain
MQADLAEQIGVHIESLKNWERGATAPTVRYIPKILEFLGYNPEPLANCQAGRIIHTRRRLGLTQEQLAERLAVDPVTLYRWENGIALASEAIIQQIEELIPAPLPVTPR